MQKLRAWRSNWDAQTRGFLGQKKAERGPERQSRQLGESELT